jgi:hypothetical protein
MNQDKTGTSHGHNTDHAEEGGQLILYEGIEEEDVALGMNQADA